MAESAITERNDFIELLKYGPLQLEGPLSVAEFISLYRKFPDLRMEREKNGKVIIMTPVKKGSGKRESILNGHIWQWAFDKESGEVYSPSTGIQLPSGAIKSPDCAWVSNERLAQQPEDKEEAFLKVVPDFVAEIRSDSDSLVRLKRKMADAWMANGVRLAWLIDPYQEKAWIYRPEREVEVISGFADKTLSGEDTLPGLELPLEPFIP
jgi:Uma2 family endonuclease